MQVKDLKNYNFNDLEDIVWLSKLIDKDSKCMFIVKPFKQMKFGEVIKLKDMLRASKSIDNILIKSVSLFSNLQIKDKEIEKANLKEYFNTINVIEDNFKEIYKYELLLQGSRDIDLENAGADELTQFGDLNIIDSLAGGDILKWEAVTNLQWWDVFNKLLKDKKERDVQRRYAKIQEAKSKTK